LSERAVRSSLPVQGHLPPHQARAITIRRQGTRRPGLGQSAALANPPQAASPTLGGICCRR